MLIMMVSFVLFILLSSSSSLVADDARVGFQAPNFAVSNKTATAQLQDYRGKYVVVTFWSSIDPESRMANMELDRACRGNARLAHIAVNYDSSRRVYGEIVKLDNLDSNSQFYGNDAQGKALVATWHQDEGYSSFLIDPQGKIVAKNPNVEMLKRI